MVTAPVIELHLSNIPARDELHRHSLVSTLATAVLAGLGAPGYPIAVHALAALLGD